ncbi:hypothetical protein COCOBI_05-4760 [Coccomyxa sp. Obi]|nr:hypothetical protein COCOBI_05-4760 [Coccomyxa sp. Obi]
MLLGNLNTVPQASDDCNNSKRKPPVSEYLPPPPPIPCLMDGTCEVQGPLTTMGFTAEISSATGPRTTQVHEAMRIAANTGEAVSTVSPATMSTSDDARPEFAREQHARSTSTRDDSTKTVRTQRVEGANGPMKVQPKLGMSQAWEHQKPLRALPPPVCKENESGPVANTAPNSAASKSHIRIVFQPRPAAGRRVQQQPPPRFQEKSTQSMPKEEATGAQRKVQEDGKAEVTTTVSKDPSGADTIGQATSACKASANAAMRSEQAPLLATCRWIIGEDAWQQAKLQGVPEGQDVQPTCTAVQAGTPRTKNASMCASREDTAQQLGHTWVGQTLKQSCAADRAAVHETQDNPITDTICAGEVIQVSERAGRDQENTQQKKNSQESQIPFEHVSKRRTKPCTPRSTTAAVQTSTTHSFLTDEESFTWYDSYADLEDGVQFTLEELLKLKLLYPDSISEMCLSKFAALRSDQQNQVVCILYDTVTEKRLTTSVNLFLWDTVKTLPIMPYCLLAPSVQEIAKSTMEKAASCDRIKGELDNRCWSKIASSSEAVQYKVFEDLNNAISKPKWQVNNLPWWTLNSIRRHTPQLPRNANKATEFTTSAFKGKRHREEVDEAAGGYAKKRRYY